jgi:hypothetical protein
MARLSPVSRFYDPNFRSGNGQGQTNERQGRWYGFFDWLASERIINHQLSLHIRPQSPSLDLRLDLVPLVVGSLKHKFLNQIRLPCFAKNGVVQGQNKGTRWVIEGPNGCIVDHKLRFDSL